MSSSPAIFDEKSDIFADQEAQVTSGHLETHFVLGNGLAFVGEQGGNGADATYQDVNGAPVEKQNPLGYGVGWWSALFLNITMIIGTGIFSFRESFLSLFFERVSLKDSFESPQVPRVCGAHLAVLANWSGNLVGRYLRLSRIRLILPQSIRCRGCLPGTSLSPAQVLFPRGICGADRDSVIC